MIKLTRINNKVFYLNSRAVEMIEEVPDTVIQLSNGSKYIVCESAREIMQAIREQQLPGMLHLLRNPGEGEA